MRLAAIKNSAALNGNGLYTAADAAAYGMSAAAAAAVSQMSSGPFYGSPVGYYSSPKYAPMTQSYSPSGLPPHMSMPVSAYNSAAANYSPHMSPPGAGGSAARSSFRSSDAKYNSPAVRGLGSAFSSAAMNGYNGVNGSNSTTAYSQSQQQQSSTADRFHYVKPGLSKA